MVVERSFGVLKSRFRALGNHVVAVWDKGETIKMVIAACVLHNICRRYHDDDVGLQEPDERATGEVSDETRGELRSVATYVRSVHHEWATRVLPSYYFDTDQVENPRANLWTPQAYTRQQRNLKNGRSLANGVNDENDLDLSSTVGVGAKRRRPAGLDDDYGLD